MGMGNPTFSLGNGEGVGGGEWLSKASAACPQLPEDSLASSTWCCRKGKAQKLQRGETPGLQSKNRLDGPSDFLRRQIQTGLVPLPSL